MLDAPAGPLHAADGSDELAETVVKRCPLCSRQFTVHDLLTDAEIKAVGMMSRADGFDQPVYFFNHNCPGCGTSFTVPIFDFKAFIKEEIPEESAVDSPECGGHCKHLDDHRDCTVRCSSAPYRRFLVTVLLGRRGKGAP